MTMSMTPQSCTYILVITMENKNAWCIQCSHTVNFVGIQTDEYRPTGQNSRHLNLTHEESNDEIVTMLGIYQNIYSD